MNEIQLSVHGRTLPLQIRRSTTTTSLHSGRDLAELHAWLTTPDAEMHHWLTETLPALGPTAVRAQDAEGEFAGKWCVSWNSYSETGGVHSYALILREAEELSLDALVLDGRELHPYEYREELVDEGLLTISAKLVGTEADVLELRSLLRERDVFSVVRRGIQDEPRPMRLGVGEWSENDGRVKYRLVLLDQRLERSAASELIRIEEENSRAALGFYANFIERLTELLVAREVVSAAEVDALREAARAELGVSRHELWRVPDVDLL